MGLLFAGLSAFLFGAADFSGGVATKRAPATAVVFVSQVAGLLLIVALLGFLGGPMTGEDIAWSVGAGVAGGLGLVALYAALASSPMAIAAPMTALVGAAVPILFGLGLGERPGPLAWAGIGVAFPAILLLAADPGAKTSGGVKRAVVLGTLAGAAFGLFFVLISRTADESGMGPIAAARIGSLTVLGAVALARRGSVAAVRHAWRPTLIAGLLDVAANAFFLLAVRRSLLAIVAVVSSLYPVGTVALAATVLDERPRPHQVVGLVVAVMAIALIALG